MLSGNNTESDKFEEWPKEKHQKTNNDLQATTQQKKIGQAYCSNTSYL
jgi:hypothetical protein